jgi:hypothetical protein
MRDDGTKGLMAKAPLLPVPSVFRLSIDGFVKSPSIPNSGTVG